MGFGGEKGWKCYIYGMKGKFLLWLVFLTFCLKAQVKKNDSVRNEPGTHGTLINDTKTEKDTSVLHLKGFVWPSYNQSLDTIKAPAAFDNLYSRSIYSDPEASSFVIFIKKEVKEHKHATHAEHIVVLEGEADMTLDTQNFKIRKGDMIFVPKNSWHAVKVTSKVALKVLSIQAPNFDGKDRIFKESK